MFMVIPAKLLSRTSLQTMERHRQEGRRAEPFGHVEAGNEAEPGTSVESNGAYCVTGKPADSE